MINGGALVSISQHKAPDVAAQVVNFANQYRALAPQGLFKEGDDFSAIIKTIDSVDARRLANQRRSQSQNEDRLVLNEPLPLDCGRSWSKTSQGVLYGQLIETYTQRVLEATKRKANESRDRFSLANLRYKNWLSLMNSDSGAWLSAGLSPKLSQSNQETPQPTLS